MMPIAAAAKPSTSKTFTARSRSGRSRRTLATTKYMPMAIRISTKRRKVATVMPAAPSPRMNAVSASARKSRTGRSSAVVAQPARRAVATCTSHTAASSSVTMSRNVGLKPRLSGTAANGRSVTIAMTPYSPRCASRASPAAPSAPATAANGISGLTNTAVAPAAMPASAMTINSGTDAQRSEFDMTATGTARAGLRPEFAKNDLVVVPGAQARAARIVQADLETVAARGQVSTNHYIIAIDDRAAGGPLRRGIGAADGRAVLLGDEHACLVQQVREHRVIPGRRGRRLPVQRQAHGTRGAHGPVRQQIDAIGKRDAERRPDGLIGARREIT